MRSAVAQRAIAALQQEAIKQGRQDYERFSTAGASKQR
jgi:hypothetical protein